MLYPVWEDGSSPLQRANEEVKTMFRISYTYTNPSSSGPFKGKMQSAVPMKRGDEFPAVMGRAVVVSCRAVKPQPTALIP